MTSRFSQQQKKQTDVLRQATDQLTFALKTRVMPAVRSIAKVRCRQESYARVAHAHVIVDQAADARSGLSRAARDVMAPTCLRRPPIVKRNAPIVKRNAPIVKRDAPIVKRRT